MDGHESTCVEASCSSTVQTQLSCWLHVWVHVPGDAVANKDQMSSLEALSGLCSVQGAEPAAGWLPEEMPIVRFVPAARSREAFIIFICAYFL